MKVRKLSPTGEPLFGYPSSQFWLNTPEGVAQAISTRLKLLQGEWFLDATAGTPFSSQILGKHSQASADLAFREVILNTQGVDSIVAFSSRVDPITRKYNMACQVKTVYGTVSLVTPL